MPFIKSYVSCPVTEEQELNLKTRMGKAISKIPGKSEEYLLLKFTDNCRLWLRGDNTAPIAYIEAAIFGNEDHLGFSGFSAEITSAFSEILRIPPENIYIKYDDISSWSVGGQYIDRRMFR